MLSFRTSHFTNENIQRLLIEIFYILSASKHFQNCICNKNVLLPSKNISNIIIPTQYVLIGILAMAGIPYDRWLRFILPFMLKVVVVSSIALAVAVMIGYS